MCFLLHSQAWRSKNGKKAKARRKNMEIRASASCGFWIAFNHEVERLNCRLRQWANSIWESNSNGNQVFFTMANKSTQIHAKTFRALDNFPGLIKYLMQTQTECTKGSFESSNCIEKLPWRHTNYGKLKTSKLFKLVWLASNEVDFAILSF